MTHDPVSVTPFAIGVDVGGTKIAAAVVAADGRIVGKGRVPTDTSQPEAVLDSIAAAVHQALDAARVRAGEVVGIGLGIPGIVDGERGIARLAVNLSWRDMPVKERLEALFGLPCVVENDVSAAVLGEHRYGLGSGHASMTFLSLGTGIAARSILNGTLWRGASGLAGDVSHIIIVPDGPPCACGARGCLEAVAAGPAIARRAAEALAAGRASSLGEGASAEQVFAAAERGDALAREVLSEAGAAIAFAISLLALTVNPEIVVLGGGLASPEGPLVAATREALAHGPDVSPVFRAALDVGSVLVSTLGPDAAVLGAASLVLPPAAPAGEGRHE